MTTASTRSPILLDSEMTTAILRLLAALAMATLYLSGQLPDRFDVAGIAFTAATLYAIAMFAAIGRRFRNGQRYPLGLIVALTVSDNAIIIGLAAITGGVGSEVTGILVLVITTVAARFGVRTAIWSAIADAVALVTIEVAVDVSPDPLDERLRLVGWWTWLLVGGAVLAGMIARAAFEYRHDLASARQAAAIDRLDRELEHQARVEVEQADATRRAFLAVTTHELRTPIASIGALTRALTTRPGALTDDERVEALGLIQSHAAHLGRMLDDVRSLSIPPSTPSVPRVEDVDLDHLVRASASAAGVPTDRCRIELPASVRRVRTDPERMRRILTNLLENAWRHSQETVDVEAHDVGGRLHVAVSDRGSGLSPAVAARAFERDFSFGTERGSSGLGLWIVRELVTSLGGSVWAAARDGGGLVVHVEVPGE